MDTLQMTAPCGLACFNCHLYSGNQNKDISQLLERDTRLNGVPAEVMICDGCRNQGGVLKSHQFFFNRTEPCYVYKCTTEKGINFCYECDDFPCDHLHPHADRANQVPHNTKLFNLCLIKKMGLEKWAKEKAASVKENYFFKWFRLE